MRPAFFAVRGALASCAFAFAAASASAAAVNVIIRDHTFHPALVHVKPGQPVVWTNMDEDVHTVTSGTSADTNAFVSSPGIADGKTFTLRLSKPGRYPYFCKPHFYEASMHGTVVVDRNR